jgi:hypothetical protein
MNPAVAFSCMPSRGHAGQPRVQKKNYDGKRQATNNATSNESNERQRRAAKKNNQQQKTLMV